ncbi:AcrR family transcriptional regulator [Streptomyces sp. B3I7]|uniref:TetR family transcriptional regulator n=1 Tax=Streptomyces sp. B3I7 TaxID=3042269 RepID=UPI0027853587|nr:TetR family transcriptional regulator [Streptomyces sp. B3I7]MDQ0811043.1 AcrR family transcriptional regulator [Streptomyces sp. B3I7]
MSHTSGIRQAQKQKTRRALLDAALVLLEEQSLSSLGLREVTRAVGVAPTAFYRHFRSTADLGVALVEEALGSLHPMIGATVSVPGDSEERITRAVELISRHVEAHPAHVRFVARERHGGVAPVREAIRRELARFAEEVRAELAGHPESEGWSDDDLLMLAELYVDQMLMTASLFLEAQDAQEAEEVQETEATAGAEAGTTDGPAPAVRARAREHVARVATRQMRLISIGRRHWLDG